MTTNEWMHLVELATKDLKETVYTYLHITREQGYCYLPKNCTKAAINRRIT